jgi:hypothetical protein
MNRDGTEIWVNSQDIGRIGASQPTDRRMMFDLAHAPCELGPLGGNGVDTWISTRSSRQDPRDPPERRSSRSSVDETFASSSF